MTDYIHVEKWEEFQHYKDRRPPWIKVYTDLHHRDAFLDLTLAQRAILLGIWIEFAASGGEIELSTRKLSQRLGARVTQDHLEALNHAGFIRFSASAEKSREEKKEDEPVAEPMKPLEALPDLRAWKVGA